MERSILFIRSTAVDPAARDTSSLHPLTRKHISHSRLGTVSSSPWLRWLWAVLGIDRFSIPTNQAFLSRRHAVSTGVPPSSLDLLGSCRAAHRIASHPHRMFPSAKNNLTPRLGSQQAGYCRPCGIPELIPIHPSHFLWSAIRSALLSVLADRSLGSYFALASSRPTYFMSLVVLDEIFPWERKVPPDADH